MSKTAINKSLSIAMAITFAATVTAIPMANANTNPFGMQNLQNSYTQIADNNSNEGKCGMNKMKAMEKGGKCGMNKMKAMEKGGKCGANKMKAMEKEGKCGANKMKAMEKEGKCGMNKMKKMEH